MEFGSQTPVIRFLKQVRIHMQTFGSKGKEMLISVKTDKNGDYIRRRNDE